MDLMPRRFFDDMFDDFLTTRKEQHMKCDIYEKVVTITLKWISQDLLKMKYL